MSSSSGFARRAPAFAGCSRAPWPTASWCERCVGTAICSASTTSTRPTARRSSIPRSASRGGSTSKPSPEGSIVYSTQPTADGYAGDQTLIAPAFTSTDEELSLVVERMTDTVRAVEQWVKSESAVPA